MDVRSFWRDLATRERRLILLGVAVFVGVVAYAFLFEPAWTGIRKLKADLPQLREQNATMRAMADETQRLRAAGGNATALAPADRLAAVRRSLTRAGLLGGAAAAATPTGPVTTLTTRGPVTSVSATRIVKSNPPEVIDEGNGRVRVRFDDIDYGTWVAWLASSEVELNARASRVSVSSVAPSNAGQVVGRVRADAVFDWTATPTRS